ncbi:MAG TPA: cytochrome P450 [Streptosporangiaceae bacterium]
MRYQGSDRSLSAGPEYQVGRDPECDIVVADPRVSWRHATIRAENGHWLLTDNGSTNGTFAQGQRLDRIKISAECVVRLGHPADGPVLSCTVTPAAPPAAARPAAGLGPAGADPAAVPEPAGQDDGLTRPLASPVLRIGRAPDNDLVVAHPSASRQHAELRYAAGQITIADLGSINGTFVNGQRVDSAVLSEGDTVRIGSATFLLAGHELQPVPVLGSPAAQPAPPPAQPEPPPAQPVLAGQLASPALQAAAPPAPPAPPVPQPASSAARPAPPAGAGPVEIPYAIRWLVPKGERFANFDILNDNDTQLDYYRRFGHIYAVGIPTKKWRLVVVSDPELLDEVAGDEEQFGKQVEEINFFAQLRNSRGGGISVIGDGEHYEKVRRVMLPWYSPQHQRTQLELMKEQARRLVAAWSGISDDEPLDARSWLERYTLEVSGRGACNYNFGLLDGSGPAGPHPFAQAVPESTKESIRRVADPRPDFTLFASSSQRARRQDYLRHNQELFRTAASLVHARMHTGPLGQQNDLLSRLVSTPDPETGEYLDAETMRDQVLMHLSNGFNGASITGGWLAYVLATHPEVEAKLVAEIDQITGGDPEYELSYDDLMSLTYTTAVIKETLRAYPPMPVTIRRSLKDGVLGRYRIRARDIILVGTLAAQRDPRYWGADPDRFDPEQFATEKVIDRPRHAFIPFSIGKRQCMAQEVTFMMLRVLLFEIYRNYRLRIAPGATVTRNTVVTTKPAAVPVIRLARDQHPGRLAAISAAPPAADAGQAAPAAGAAGAQPAAAVLERTAGPAGLDWGDPTEIPPQSAYGHVVIAYGSNFGANRELAEGFAERSHFHGYTSDMITLNELADAPLPAKPWLLVVLTSTYTSNPPSNATKFKAWLERADPGSPVWQNCRFLVWGLGNSQWNAFLAFPRYVHKKLSELGASPLADLGYADVGTPGWEQRHTEWNGSVWPLLLELSGARRSEAAAARAAAARAAAGALIGADSGTAMHRSLLAADAAPEPAPAPAGRVTSFTSVMRALAPETRRRSVPDGGPRTGAQPRVLLAPTILPNAVGVQTVAARATACRELLPAGSPKRIRHLELALPSGVSYRAGDHLGLCPKNDEERVERLAAHLGAELDGLLMVPNTLNVSAVPKGTVLQVRNVLTSLVDISGRPTVPLLDLLLEKATDPAERSRLTEIRDVLQAPEGPDSPLRAALDAGGYDVLQLLDEFTSCSLNVFEFLQVARQLRPRYYSVSSSPRIHGAGVAHLTVGFEPAPVPGMTGRDFRGMSSHYVHEIRAGDRVSLFLDSADGFCLQDDAAKPMIFVSAGTGFAPMRAFLWERLAMKHAGTAMAEAALFNGIRSSSVDYIYRDEVARFTAEGVLDHVHVAASREQPEHREHVQDRIREQGALVWRLLAAGGYIYVCGSQPMRDAVRTAFVDVVAEYGALPRDRAAAYLDEMEQTTRYRPDLWG